MQYSQKLKKAKRLAEGTYNMITHFADQLSHFSLSYIDMQNMLKEHWGGEEGYGHHSSSTQQNN